MYDRDGVKAQGYDGLYSTFSPRASMRAFASLRAQVWMLQANGQYIAIRCCIYNARTLYRVYSTSRPQPIPCCQTCPNTTSSPSFPSDAFGQAVVASIDDRSFVSILQLTAARHDTPHTHLLSKQPASGFIVMRCTPRRPPLEGWARGNKSRHPPRDCREHCSRP